MHRIFTACVDVAASMVVLIPLFAVGNLCSFRKWKHTALYTVFALYLIAVMSLVGLPNVSYVQWDVSVNPIPFVGMIPDLANTLLNVLLFVPMGFLLPILWKECRQLKRTFIICLCCTIVIEVLQLFTFRATDINDIITNTAGGLLGYSMAKVVSGGFTKLVCTQTKPYEMYIVFAAAFAAMFFIVPWISTGLWEMLL